MCIYLTAHVFLFQILYKPITDTISYSIWFSVQPYYYLHKHRLTGSKGES